MLILSENVELAKCYIEDTAKFKRISVSALQSTFQNLWNELSSENTLYSAEITSNTVWDVLFIISHAERSQYDALAKFSHEQKYVLSNILCLADSGNYFHGQRNRHWESLSGNIHLSALLSPSKTIDNFAVAFQVLSAVSVLDTIDSVKGLNNKAKIKWVNDIFIDNSKVCGVISQTQVQSNTVINAITGIGLNVETSPAVDSTLFVPATTRLADYQEDFENCNQRIVFNELIKNLSINYEFILKDNLKILLDKYNSRSMVIGRDVVIWSDPIEGEAEIIRRGKVIDIGKNLELYLEGEIVPVISGRLQLL